MAALVGEENPNYPPETNLRPPAVSFRAALSQDIKEKSGKEKLYALANGAAITGALAIGATRLPSAMSLPLAIDVMHSTGAPVGGLVAGAAYGAWCALDGRMINGGVNRLPRTFEKISERAPARLFNALLPGLQPASRPESTEDRPMPKERKLGQRALELANVTSEQLPTRIQRGIALQGPGVTPYIVSAGMQNQSPGERKKLAHNLGLDGALFMGALASSVTTALYFIDKNNPKLAEQISSLAGNKLLWLGAALIGLPAAKAMMKGAKGSYQHLRERLSENRLQIEPALPAEESAAA